MHDDGRWANPYGLTVRKFFNDDDQLIATHAAHCYRAYLEYADTNLEFALLRDMVRREDLESFSILGIVAAGAFGTVLKVAHTDRTMVALKVMDKFTLETRGNHATIVNERKLHTALENPFCAILLYAFQDVNNLYLCTDFGFYGDLRKCFLRVDVVGDIEENLAKLLVAQGVLALRYLHSCSIIHRDIKPDNIMLYKDGYIKLGHFGLSKRTREATLSLYGTPGYVAPELLLRRPYHIGVDWFSLGVTFYEVMFRSMPFCENDDDVEDQLIGTIWNLLVMPARYSDRARDFLEQLLQKDVTRRLGTRRRGTLEVMEHAWFDDIDFIKLHFKQLPMRDMLPDHLRPVPVLRPAEIPRNPQLCANNDLFKDF